MVSRILLTGADGQVGREIRNQASQCDFEIICLNKNELDITSQESLRLNINKYLPSIIVNAAAFTSVDLAEEEKSLSQKINAEGPFNISKLCESKGILLVHLSTDYVFNGNKYGPYEENEKEDPINHYGKTKYDGEKAIRSSLCKHIIIRTSWVFGVNGNNFPKTIIGLSQKLKKLKIINDTLGSPTSARSIARLVIIICKQYFQKGSLEYGIYHFTNQPQVSWHDFALSVLEVSQKVGLLDEVPEVTGISSEEYESKSLKPKNSVLSNSKVTSVFDIKIDHWKDELLYTLQGIKDNIEK